LYRNGENFLVEIDHGNAFTTAEIKNQIFFIYFVLDASFSKSCEKFFTAYVFHMVGILGWT
jgi:hypothetical protein